MADSACVSINSSGLQNTISSPSTSGGMVGVIESEKSKGGETPKSVVSPSKPPRNKLLTSQILSADEIAKEIIDRADKKRPPQLPEGGDVLFQKQITKNLATKVVKEELLNRVVPVEILTPPPPPKIPKLSNDHTDMDAQRLLTILQEGAETHYHEKVKQPRYSSTPLKPEADRELERELALKQLMEVSRKRTKLKTENNNNVPNSSVEGKPAKRLNKEVARLLQDEGAINMLYDMEKGEACENKGNLPSKRRKKKLLHKKAQEVTQAILDGSTTSKGPRLRHPNDTKAKKEYEDGQATFTSPAEASKIIRRHSSSSSYSSRGSSPRRVSGDFERRQVNEDEEVPVENGPTVSKVNNGISVSVPSPKKSLVKPKKDSDRVTSHTVHQLNSHVRLSPDKNGFKEKLQSEFSNKFKTMMVKQVILSSKRNEQSKPKTIEPVVQKPPVLSSPAKSASCEAIWQMLQDDWSCPDDIDEPVPAVTPVANKQPVVAATTPTSTDVTPAAALSPASILKTLETPKKTSRDIIYTGHKNEIAPLPSTEAENEKIPENKNDVSFTHRLNLHMYKELMLRRIGPLTHVNIAPVSTLLAQAFNVQVLKELSTVLEEVGTDCRCKGVLLTCSGNLFSMGVDLPALLHEDPLARAAAAREMASAIKEFVYKLAMFRKPVVVGVVGPCIGLGVTMLAYCDIVYASPKAIFCTPYARLGYIPEAAATLTLPLVIGQRMAMSMLIGGRKLKADEALPCGLVTAVLPEEKFTEEVLERAFRIASQSSQSMESTKVLMLHSIRSRLSAVLATEATMLQQHWLTLECQSRIKESAGKLLCE